MCVQIVKSCLRTKANFFQNSYLSAAFVHLFKYSVKSQPWNCSKLVERIYHAPTTARSIP